MCKRAQLLLGNGSKSTRLQPAVVVNPGTVVVNPGTVVET